MKNVFAVPQGSRWSYIIQNAKQNDIALNTIKKQKPSLKGALPDNYYSRFGINVSKLAAHLDEIPINRNSLFYTIRPRYHRPIITSIVERLLQLLKYADTFFCQHSRRISDLYL